MAHKSAVVIAKLLGSEGFTPHVANMIEKYWKNTIMRRGRAHKLTRREAAFKAMVKERQLSEADKLVLGRFISLHERMSFDTGLRIGMMAFAQKTDKPIFTMSREQQAILLDAEWPPLQEAVAQAVQAEQKRLRKNDHQPQQSQQE